MAVTSWRDEQEIEKGISIDLHHEATTIPKMHTLYIDLVLPPLFNFIIIIIISIIIIIIIIIIIFIISFLKLI